MASPKIAAPTNCPDDFHELFGIFHAVWLTLDVAIDFAISHLLHTSSRDTHIMVSGMMFGSKIRLLINLVQRSHHGKKGELIATLRAIQNSKRDVFAHSYFASDKDRVLFIERTKGGDYKAIEHEFTASEFRDHVANSVLNANKFQDALGVTDEDILHFARAALSENSKLNTSPREPSASK
jgi:hypothetical protein